jgi:hypothetical protein
VGNAIGRVGRIDDAGGHGEHRYPLVVMDREPRMKVDPGDLTGRLVACWLWEPPELSSSMRGGAGRNRCMTHLHARPICPSAASTPPIRMMIVAMPRR